MRALITKAVTVACKPGSIVEITGEQFRLLGASATKVLEEDATKPEAVKDVAKGKKKG